MNGRRYYSLRAAREPAGAHHDAGGVLRARLHLSRPANSCAWLDSELAASAADWKIVFLHHPLYTSGRYRASAFVHALDARVDVRDATSVNVVFSGHEHIYQRSTLQNGIQYFVSGGAGSLRPGDGVPASYIARTYSGDYHFMLVEIEGEVLHFQAISRTGAPSTPARLSRTEPRPPPRASQRWTRWPVADHARPGP